MTRVLIVADSEESAASLALLLGEDDRLEVVGVSAAAAVSASSVAEAHPDVILLSRVSPAAFRIHRLPVVVLSDDRPGTWEWQEFVKARLPIHVTPAEAFAALIAAAQGLTVLTSTQAEALMSLSPTAPQIPEPLVEPLTPRELQVLRMMAQGLANKEIAEQLGISDHTAKFHVASVLGKLQAATRTEAVTQGIRRGLVPI